MTTNPPYYMIRKVTATGEHWLAHNPNVGGGSVWSATPDGALRYLTLKMASRKAAAVKGEVIQVSA